MTVTSITDVLVNLHCDRLQTVMAAHINDANRNSASIPGELNTALVCLGISITIPRYDIFILCLLSREKRERCVYVHEKVLILECKFILST